MVTGFERIVIDVPDLKAASDAYRRLIGLNGNAVNLPRSGEASWFGLGNTLIELRQTGCAAAFVSAVVFSSDDELSPGPFANALDLELVVSDGGDLLAEGGRALPVGDLRVDHLVLRTGDAQACIDLFRDRLGIRLALDKVVPEWGGRMLFFRAGKLTLEVIASDRNEVATFWGIAYQCPDLEATRARLESEGVAVSDIREGRKPGTRVATVKSDCLEIPTLLIEPAT